MTRHDRPIASRRRAGKERRLGPRIPVTPVVVHFAREAAGGTAGQARHDTGQVAHDMTQRDGLFACLAGKGQEASIARPWIPANTVAGRTEADGRPHPPRRAAAGDVQGGQQLTSSPGPAAKLGGGRRVVSRQVFRSGERRDVLGPDCWPARFPRGPNGVGREERGSSIWSGDFWRVVHSLRRRG